MISETHLNALACPNCRFPLHERAGALACANAECAATFPVRNGVPILLGESDPDGYYHGEQVKWDGVLAYGLGGTPPRRVPDFERFALGSNMLRDAYRHLRGSSGTVLDVGCGAGYSAMALAGWARRVYTFDISETGVRALNSAAQAQDVRNVFACCANAERLPYPDGLFDAVFGKAVLHHLRLPVVLPELSRVMKKGARAAFCEPLAHNPVVNAVRFIKHHWIDSYPGTDKPFRFEDAERFRPYFSRVEFVATTYLKDRVPLLAPLERAMLRVPPLRRRATYGTILLEK
ncbi:MAG TPA: methyltransferase domain-containing protein [Kiritimatiellia bacterium]|jgi:SAM-dependent methyltransferase/uncharacterized protein YbaR (Trm112 family)